jgi:uncharacterized membrane protein
MVTTRSMTRNLLNASINSTKRDQDERDAKIQDLSERIARQEVDIERLSKSVDRVRGITLYAMSSVVGLATWIFVTYNSVNFQDSFEPFHILKNKDIVSYLCNVTGN